MAPEQFKRKLTTIFSADVAGYSRLMGEDEAATVKTLEQFKGIMSELIRQHRGRVVDSPGDNLLAEFTSVVDAVQCAVATQKELQARNAALTENRRMQFRIGVNLGDVIEEESRIYGDGVNIAARLESLADPGGICISKTAFEQIETKLPFGYAYLGEQTVKNVVKPVGAYRVMMEPRVMVEGIKSTIPPAQLWRKKTFAGGLAVLVLIIGVSVWNFYFRLPSIELASEEKMAFPLPDVPSIAILPFVNLSGDPKEEYFSDGLTEQIITSLSTFPRLFVISRNSTFVYKGKPVKIQKVAEDLGVRYVMEGSVQKSGDKVRVTAQLVDAISGHHVWSERYDREAKDIFALQDEITLKIGQAMKFELTEKEQEYPYAKWRTDNLKAFEKNYLGVGFLRRNTKQGNDAARQLFEEALSFDPKYVLAHTNLAWTHFWDARMGWSESPAKSIQRAYELAQQILATGDSNDPAYTLMASVYLLMGQLDNAIAAAERAVAINPNGAEAYLALAGIVGCAGKWEESILYAKKSIRLDPFPRPIPNWFLGRAYFMTGQYDESIAILKKALKINPDYQPAHLFLAACYSLMGRDAEAAAASQEVLRINPKFSIESYSKTIPYKDQADVERELVALRKAGLPDKPPLPLPDKPSIAVLPFINMSKDPEQDYFGDGLAEEIINALAKLPQVFVIARNSSFSYKGKSMDVRQIGRELGVKFVFEGSIRQEGKRVRITAQLVDTSTGHHVFSEKYDRHLQEIFVTQDDITMRIVKALQLNLTEGEQALIYAKGTKNLEAYLKLLQATEYGRRQNPNDNEKAKRIIEEAIELDRDYPMAFRILGALYMMEVWLGSSSSPQNSLRKAAELSQKAIDLDPFLGMAYAVLGHIYMLFRDFERGIELGQKAVELEPNGADSHAYLGMGLVFADRPEEAVMTFNKAIRLNPDAPAWYLLNLATAYRVMGSYDKAIEWAKKAVERQPTNPFAHLVLTGSYSLAGRDSEARAEAEQVLRMNPKFSLERFAQVNPYKNQEAHKQHINSLSRAGLK